MLNCKKNVVLYKLSFYENKWMILSPLYATILPLIDGVRTFREIMSIVSYVFDIESISKIKMKLEKIINNINDEDDVIVKLKKKQGVADYKVTDFVIPLKDFDASQRRTGFPLSVLVLLTNKCQTNCIYCYADRRKSYRKDELNFQQLLALFNQIKSYGIEKIDISGGDVLAREDSTDIIKWLLNNDFLFFISTKCYVDDNFSRMLFENGYSKNIKNTQRDFQVSIDSINPRVAEYLTNKKGYLQIATESVKNLIKNNIEVKVKTVLTPLNSNEPEEIIKYFHGLGVKKFQFVYYGRSYYNHKDFLFLTNQQKIQLDDLAFEIQCKYSDLDITFQSDKFDDDLESKKEIWKNRAKCSGGFSSLVIAPNGDVILCEQMPQTKDFIMGNIKDRSIYDIWHGKEIDAFINAPKNRFKDSVCYNCNEFEICHYDIGYCYKNSLFAYDNVFEAPPECPYQTKLSRRLI